jgi:antitoxin component YwqK of YwqJK toxin-antitoxin module
VILKRVLHCCKNKKSGLTFYLFLANLVIRLIADVSIVPKTQHLQSYLLTIMLKKQESMRLIIFIILLSTSISFSQNRQELENQINRLLNEYGTFIPQNSSNETSSQQNTCNVTFKDGNIEILLTHHGDVQAIKSIEGADPINSVVNKATIVNKYSFNVSAIKLKESGSLDYNLLQYETGKAYLYLKVHSGSLQSFTDGEIHKKNDINNKVNVYRYFNESGIRITKFNESFAQALVTVPKTEIKLIRIPLSNQVSNSDWFINTLNQLFIKYLNPNRDITYKYDNWKTTSETHFLNGLKHGYSTHYYSNRKPRLVEIWENGKRVGYKDQFLPDGTHILEDGHGLYMTYDKDGKLTYAAEHSDGKRAGVATWYYENGEIRESAKYKYNPNDILGYRWEIISSFNKDGTPREKGTLKNGNGTWNIYDDSGKLTEVLEFKNGILVK